MVSKSAVKVFKRKDVESPIHNISEPKTLEPEKGVVIAERHSRRELVNTVSSWVTERRERSRTEEIEGLRRIFGDSVPSLSRA
ncbi:MAG: hypothetical protein ABI954_11445 [Pyrinomonadaceae bacterium]